MIVTEHSLFSWSNRPRCWEKEECGPGERLHVAGKDIAQDVVSNLYEFSFLSLSLSEYSQDSYRVISIIPE